MAIRDMSSEDRYGYSDCDDRVNYMQPNSELDNKRPTRIEAVPEGMKKNKFKEGDLVWHTKEFRSGMVTEDDTPHYKSGCIIVYDKQYGHVYYHPDELEPYTGQDKKEVQTPTIEDKKKAVRALFRDEMKGDICRSSIEGIPFHVSGERIITYVGENGTEYTELFRDDDTNEDTPEGKFITSNRRVNKAQDYFRDMMT